MGINMDLKAYMEEKGLNISAGKFPMPNIHNSWKDVDGNLVIPRDDLDTGLFSIQNISNGTIFNTGVKKNYQVLQYAESFQKLQEIAKITDIKLVDGGVWRGGAEAFIQFDLPGTIQVGNGGDTIVKRLTAISSHSSMYAFTILITPYRLFCQNQIPSMFALSKKEQAKKMKTMLRIKHTTGGLKQIGEMEKWLEVVNGEFKTIEGMYNRLNEIKITSPAMIQEVFTRIFKVKEDSKKSLTMTKTQVSDALNRFMDADGGSVERNTAWNLANAIQGAFQHSPMKKSVSHARSVLIGSIAAKSVDAFSTVMEVCSTSVTDPSKYRIDADIQAMLGNISF